MDISVDNKGGLCKMRLAGEFNIYQAAECKERLAGCLAGARTMEIDLGGVTEIDTSCIQILILGKREAGRLGKGFRLSVLSGAVETALDIYNLRGFFEEA
ncbi:MAG: STAS domain-containing protein [Deltaproteobacteria bacterium]|nr:STAS domain-containing protein [Deltaproteobacteria bacterium]